MTTPDHARESGTAYVDVALALHAAVACYALARHAERGDLAWGALAALHFGGAAATKHLGVVVTIVALTLYVFAMVRSGARPGPTIRRAVLVGAPRRSYRSPGTRAAWWRQETPSSRTVLRVRASPPERWDAVTERGLAGFKARFGYGRSFADLIRLPWDVTMHAARFGGSLGPLFLMLLPGAFLLRPRRRAALLLGAAVIAYAASGPLRSAVTRCAS